MEHQPLQSKDFSFTWEVFFFKMGEIFITFGAVIMKPFNFIRGHLKEFFFFKRVESCMAPVNLEHREPRTSILGCDLHFGTESGWK